MIRDNKNATSVRKISKVSATWLKIDRYNFDLK